jgi:CubicO group peptidase (beta-lactamase class C family)
MESDMTKALDQLAGSRVPGVSALTVSKDTMTEATSAGVRDLATGAPTTVDTVDLWFSMTKIVTATAAMQLAERGALSLDDPVERFLPEFPAPRVGWPEVRVRHLLSHSAGLANPVPVRWVHPADAGGRDPHKFARELLGRCRKLRFPAGSKAVYSNVGYIALGEVIGAASGQRYEAYVRSQILEPLSTTVLATTSPPAIRLVSAR